MMDIPNERKRHKFPTPSSGGLIFIIPVFVSLAVVNLNYENFVFIFCFLLFILLGFIDDRINLSSRTKFIFQFCIAAVAVFAFGSFEFLGQLGIISEWFSFTVTLVFIVTIINAFNLIDGSDGVAASYAILVFTFISVIAFYSNQVDIGVLSALLAVGVFAFIQFNFYPAKIFMGDTGSLALGFAIPVLSLQLLNSGTNELFHAHYVIIPLLLVPAMDTLRVMVWRILKGKNPFKADLGHMHHMLMKIGFKPSSIAILFSVISLLIICESIFCLYLEKSIFITLILTSITSMVGFSIVILFILSKVKGEIKKRLSEKRKLERSNALLIKNY